MSQYIVSHDRPTFGSRIFCHWFKWLCSVGENQQRDADSSPLPRPNSSVSENGGARSFSVLGCFVFTLCHWSKLQLSFSSHLLIVPRRAGICLFFVSWWLDELALILKWKLTENKSKSRVFFLSFTHTHTVPPFSPLCSAALFCFT